MLEVETYGAGATDGLWNSGERGENGLGGIVDVNEALRWVDKGCTVQAYANSVLKDNRGRLPGVTEGGILEYLYRNGVSPLPRQVASIEDLVRTVGFDLRTVDTYVGGKFIAAVDLSKTYLHREPAYVAPIYHLALRARNGVLVNDLLPTNVYLFDGGYHLAGVVPEETDIGFLSAGRFTNAKGFPRFGGVVPSAVTLNVDEVIEDGEVGSFAVAHELGHELRYHGQKIREHKERAMAIIKDVMTGEQEIDIKEVVGDLVKCITPLYTYELEAVETGIAVLKIIDKEADFKTYYSFFSLATRTHYLNMLETLKTYLLQLERKEAGDTQFTIPAPVDGTTTITLRELDDLIIAERAVKTASLAEIRRLREGDG